jgi:hypothetical protein
MQDKKNDKNYFFVDESGDPTFYNRYGRFIVGEEGCSKILIIGFITTNKPAELRRSILKLKEEIVNDPYLQGVPSLEKTKNYFHASVDIPEIREKVFKLIVGLNFKAEFIVARKKEKIFKKRHRGRPNVFYDDVVAKLFMNKLHLADESYIYYEIRGSRKRQEPFEDAIRTAINIFEKRWGMKNDSEIKIFPMSSVGEPCLQIIDYMNWAVQRAFLKKDDRFVKFVENKISLICDVYDSDNYPNIYYTNKNKFDVNKISPL